MVVRVKVYSFHTGGLVLSSWILYFMIIMEIINKCCAITCVGVVFNIVQIMAVCIWNNTPMMINMWRRIQSISMTCIIWEIGCLLLWNETLFVFQENFVCIDGISEADTPSTIVLFTIGWSVRFIFEGENDKLVFCEKWLTQVAEKY